MPDLALVPHWHPWLKVTRFTGTHGRKKEGPSAVSVWQRPGQVQLDFHNARGTWATWLTLTPDEALRVAQGLIKAARAATADITADITIDIDTDSTSGSHGSEE